MRVPVIGSSLQPTPDTAGDDHIMGQSFGGTIQLREDLGEFNCVHLSVWLHEVAHEFLHHNTWRVQRLLDGYEWGGYDEIQAESIARFTLEALDIEWPDVSRENTWDSSVQLDERERRVIRLIMGYYDGIKAENRQAPHYVLFSTPAAIRYANPVQKISLGVCGWRELRNRRNIP